MAPRLRVHPCGRSRMSSRARERRLREQTTERLGLQRVPARASRLELQLVEHRLRLGRAPVCPPLAPEPCVEVLEALVRVEDAPYGQLRGDRAVPLVGLQAKGHVEASGAAEAVELASEAEGDRTTGVAGVTADA